MLIEPVPEAVARVGGRYDALNARHRDDLGDFDEAELRVLLRFLRTATATTEAGIQDFKERPSTTGLARVPTVEYQPNDPKSELHRYLQQSREALLWKLDGVSEYDARRPLVPTGTNLLGLVKHVAIVEAGYLGRTFGRPFPERLAGDDEEDDEPNLDLYATADESRADIVDLYHRVWAHGDVTIAENDLETVGRVPWWTRNPETTLHRILIHLVAENNRHAGHADILRETIDGFAGLRAGVDNLWVPPEGWRGHHDRLEKLAQQFR